jgi:hypothetical protein
MEAWRTDLTTLLDRYLGGEITVEAFTAAYEHWWNFERVGSEQTREDAAWLEELFDVVAHYSSEPEDRAAWKGFKDEPAVTSAAREVRTRLTNTPSS